ncbi:Phosphate regulon transcriptional regulatory protein PhoB (SphR) [Labilithrix luteola]|uniref:Phosphate regulon transcriptional regulatory protein PhoB (SphR) n=1 Tax=Labilithrix luteola TaxID=1391654 RepID=A0A0K1PTZ1_9BACT|nr:response regulator transcription factor [Labilithrix luteola]AKU96599.1 Phosphate regulon transcriptional regulatory protein PhoB (SphR) [Labilithrix luteola]
MTPSATVLLVEDDERLATFTAQYLSERGLLVVHAADGDLALREFQKRTFDVVVLDVMLPNRDGLTVCKTIRQTSDVPILLVTARGEETDRVLGLELGADDYVVKPFSPRELLARVTAFVRRHRGELLPKTSELRVGRLVAARSTMTASLDGEALTLSPTEFQLLLRFMERPGRVLSRDQLLELVKGSADEAFDRAIDVQVSRLRQKLGDDGAGLIKTIRGVGYMLVADPK